MTKPDFAQYKISVGVKYDLILKVEPPGGDIRFKIIDLRYNRNVEIDLTECDSRMLLGALQHFWEDT
jgi:hypothetical protein